MPDQKWVPWTLESAHPPPVSLRLPFLLVLLALVGLAGCDSSDSSDCGTALDTVADGTFDFQFEEAGGCFALRGESARFNVRGPDVSDNQTVLGQFLLDDPEESTDAAVTFVQFLATGDGPLAVGTYDVADAYSPSTAPLAPGAGDVRFVEYPGQVILQTYISVDDNFYSRSGTLTVTRSGPDGFAGQIDAVLARQETTDRVDRPGAELRIRGAFAIDKRGASTIITF